MNEQFSLLVRRHLLETADERPGAGQLAAVLQLTVNRAQQPSWLVRLRWIVSPAAPVASAWLRYGLLAVAVLVAAGSIALLGGGGSADPQTDFQGRWTSTDPGDDSTQTLVVGPGPAPVVHFEDAFSINCQMRGDSSTLFLADGPGQILLNRLVARFPDGGCTIHRVGPYEVHYDYDPVTDTLHDNEGIIWYRLP